MGRRDAAAPPAEGERAIQVYRRTRARSVALLRRRSSAGAPIADGHRARACARSRAPLAPAQKHYETKQYKKGLKAADAVLKKHPEHGETLAMRGLILNCMDRKAEAYEYVKKGLSKDIRSHVCWHVFGLVHRSDRDYKEAVKCYRNALRIEPDNLQILRDLSLLQVQLRDRLGYLETRHVLLKLKPAMRLNWIGIAVANHLLGRHARAIDVLSAYENTLEGSPEPESAYERSEMALYKLELMKDAGMRTEALELLGKSEAQIVDKTAVRELRAELHLALANYSAAASEYRRLLELNAEEHGYYAGLHAAILERPLPQPTLAGRPGGKSPYGAPATRRPTFAGLAEKERSLLLTAHAELRAAHPRASAPRRLPLDIVSAHGPEGAARFDQMFSAYVLPLLRKGVPSLFADIRPLYADAAKAERIGALLQRWEGLLAEGKPLDGGAAGGDGGACGDRGSGTEVPSTLLWVRFMLAQHHDAHGRHEEALACAEACIGHTPTLLELYVFKGARPNSGRFALSFPFRRPPPCPSALAQRRSARADAPPLPPRARRPRVVHAGRVYKHAGDWAEAAKWLEHARSLDLADRYLNTKATRYLLRADRVDEAAAVIAHFTKDGTDRESNLFDMQCMWWETEAGEALRRTGQLGKALKKLLAVERHFVDIVEDQFDFHTYCLRKMTLRSYLQLLRLEVCAAARGSARRRGARGSRLRCLPGECALCRSAPARSPPRASSAVATAGARVGPRLLRARRLRRDRNLHRAGGRGEGEGGRGRSGRLVWRAGGGRGRCSRAQEGGEQGAQGGGEGGGGRDEAGGRGEGGGCQGRQGERRGQEEAAAKGALSTFRAPAAVLARTRSASLRRFAPPRPHLPDRASASSLLAHRRPRRPAPPPSARRGALRWAGGRREA